MGVPVSVVLAMIVRNEAAVIGRCLESIRPLIDGWVIVDTGSIDGTPDVIRTALADLPGRLEHRPWVDFGHNRSELMALARGHGTHLLLLDADMTVRVEGPHPDPAADAGLLRHEGDPEYWIPRLVRSDLPWRFEGATHEYLTADRPTSTERIDAWVIEHHADGGSRSDKFTRDRALLEAELARRPDDPRTVFYLAQTLRDLGETKGAIDMYGRRVALGGWAEEVVYSRYQQGELLAPTDWDAAAEALLHAWRLRPSRVESLLLLARGHRERGHHHHARFFAELGLAQPDPGDDLLFVHPEARRWGLRFELAVAAYHCGDPAAALEANDRLLADGVPAHVEPWVRHNRAWCRRALGTADDEDRSRLPLVPGDPLPLLADLAASARRVDLEVPLAPGWSAFNPSIAAAPDGPELLVSVRSSNYRFRADGSYEIADGMFGEVIRTLNRLVRVGGDLSVNEVGAPLPMQPAGAPLFGGRVEGVEDQRLVAFDGRWYGLGTVRDRDPAERCEMALVDLGPVDAPPADPGAGLRVLAGPELGRHEKNWMPFVDGDRLLALYLCAPTVVVDLSAIRDLPPGGAERLVAPVVARTAGPPGLGALRGGSQGVPVPGGWLFAVHEVVSGGALGRVYAHRFVRLVRRGAGYEVDAVSVPFLLEGPDVEFCAGLAPHPDGERIVLSYGHRDAAARLLVAELAEVCGLLHPVRPDRP